MLRNILIKSKFIREGTLPIRKIFEKFFFKNKGFENELKKYENIYKGKPLLVVGNGPSLNKTPLDSFKHIPSVAMNKIDLLFDRVEWRPSFIICTNGIVMEQHKVVFENSTIPVLLDLKGYFLKVRGKAIQYFFMKTDKTFSKDFAQFAGGSPTVTYQAIQFAYYLGANPVIIVGVDHSFVTEGSKSTYQQTKGDDVNHFDPNYFGKGVVWGLPDLDGSEYVYSLAKKAFEDDNRMIYDATIDGKLNIFKKIDIEEAINICKK